MKNLTSRNDMTLNSIRAAMVLLLVASVATPRGMQGNRGAGAAPRMTSAPARSSYQARPTGMNSNPRPTARPTTPKTSSAPKSPVGSTTGKYTPKSPVGSNSGKNTPKPPVGSSTSKNTPKPSAGSNTGNFTPKSPVGSNTGKYTPKSPMGSNGGHTVPVVRHGHDGYVQRSAFAIRGHRFVQRTYVHGGASYTRVYHPFFFRGIELNAYAPVSFFAPAFYGWADTPWAIRVHYNWGWFGSPWFAADHGYFAPYAVYTSAPFWLADYMLATSLQQAWQEGIVAADAQAGLTPQVKQAVAMEIHRQIVQERAEASGYAATSPTFLDGRSHVFVVSSSTVADAGNQQCGLSGGDVVQLDGPAAVDGTNAAVQVVASQGQGCPAGTYVSVALDQLQEMQNWMRETMDQGLVALRSGQGQYGLPVVPADAQGMVAAPFASELPPADTARDENPGLEVTGRGFTASLRF